MSAHGQLDRYVSERIRSLIEERFLLPINRQARLEQLIRDPQFLVDPLKYVPLFSDHGVVHARDVAHQVLSVLDAVHAVLIPGRGAMRLEFMKGYGVLVAFVHDIGMVDFTPAGRAMHPEFATQAVLSPEFDDIARAIWDENCGNVPWRLARLAEKGVLEQEAPVVMREMLALANCHSRSKVSIGTLSDPGSLRQAMHECAGAELPSTAPLDVDPGERLRRDYADFERDSFRWLVSAHQETREMVSDVIDTLRALRCADALRQRGTVFKTSGGYEVFVDLRTANAVYALRLGQDELYLLEMPDRISAGEANLASSEIDREGNLRISFHRGAFADREAIERAAGNAALVVNDIQGDTIDSFRRPAASSGSSGGLKSVQAIEILLEGVDDNLEFAGLVCKQLERINAEAGARARAVPSLQNACAQELARYLDGKDLDWDITSRQEALARMAQSGHKTEAIDPILGFDGVKLVKLSAGEVLIEAGTPASFAYIPLSEGLKCSPLGGYAPVPARAWVPLGITGVIRGATRNATLTAEQELTLLMVPKGVYLRHWHQTYGAQELRQLFARRKGAGLRPSVGPTLTKIERAAILQTVPLFSEIPRQELYELASIAEEVAYEAGATIIQKGERGHELYVIIDGRVRVHDGEQTLIHLEKGDLFGEMELLDSEPRMASVTATVDTLLLRLAQEPLYGLMERQSQVAREMIRVLSRRLRERVERPDGPDTRREASIG